MDTRPISTTRDISRYRAFPSKGGPGNRGFIVLLGLNTFDLLALLKAIDKGLRWKAVQRFMRNSGLGVEEVAELITTPKRTLARRKASGRLTANESDRLLRAAKVYARVLELFDGDRESATEWLRHPNMALGGVSPLDFAKTQIGAEEVDHLIGRIEHGIFS